MNEIRQAREISGDTLQQDKAKAADRLGGEIRVLDDFELVLAGGGDQTPSWP